MKKSHKRQPNTVDEMFRYGTLKPTQLFLKDGGESNTDTMSFIENHRDKFLNALQKAASSYADKRIAKEEKEMQSGGVNVADWNVDTNNRYNTMMQNMMGIKPDEKYIKNIELDGENIYEADKFGELYQDANYWSRVTGHMNDGTTVEEGPWQQIPIPRFQDGSEVKLGMSRIDPRFNLYPEHIPQHSPDYMDFNPTNNNLKRLEQAFKRYYGSFRSSKQPTVTSRNIPGVNLDSEFLFPEYSSDPRGNINEYYAAMEKYAREQGHDYSFDPDGDVNEEYARNFLNDKRINEGRAAMNEYARMMDWKLIEEQEDLAQQVQNARSVARSAAPTESTSSPPRPASSTGTKPSSVISDTQEGTASVSPGTSGLKQGDTNAAEQLDEAQQQMGTPRAADYRFGPISAEHNKYGRSVKDTLFGRRGEKTTIQFAPYDMIREMHERKMNQQSGLSTNTSDSPTTLPSPPVTMNDYPGFDYSDSGLIDNIDESRLFIPKSNVQSSNNEKPQAGRIGRKDLIEYFEKGGEYYLTEDEIDMILKMGGQIEYLD